MRQRLFDGLFRSPAIRGEDKSAAESRHHHDADAPQISSCWLSNFEHQNVHAGGGDPSHPCESRELQERRAENCTRSVTDEALQWGGFDDI